MHASIANYQGWPLPTAAERINEGFPATALERLKDALGITDDELAETLQMAPRTFSRRKNEGRLHPDESERVYRLGRLVGLAAEVLGGEDEARAWMNELNFALGDQTPLFWAKTEPGARIVERTIEHIRSGIPV